MNLGSRFRISLKNLMICIDLLLDSWEDKEEREQRKRENQMRENRMWDERERKKNHIETRAMTSKNTKQ